MSEVRRAVRTVAVWVALFLIEVAILMAISKRETLRLTLVNVAKVLATAFLAGVVMATAQLLRVRRSRRNGLE